MSCLTVSIVLLFLFIFSLIFLLALVLPPVHQGRLISHRLCRQIPSWSFLDNSSLSWCDERIFRRPFQQDRQCPCFSTKHRPDMAGSLWPYTGLYVNH